ncbi:MaoC family dehydratase N-terminal domain-containing protein [Streptomyces sp. NBC_01728]|uniref:FAS1-like dehydratase domain-containing protein n=1 Tax=unclassified Streptomyces TaxID=2593676 RepID=UPI0022533905|nr:MULTISPECIES: MaoC family dehydratase N-terminal domain-containing protein [unclassified Streptomyces]MCX4458257.1 MaoC family dehydratase N-terminal domain-containing protein [Streptomyces sp. NBC_01719]MCX4497614.1 MaoC family dehydratase N-terminal domain-containing protein [Streptomyces sp. NBC_01728]
MPQTELDLAEERARAALGRWEPRSLGVVRAGSAAEFVRAAGETTRHFVDPGHPAFVIHPMYVVSLLRAEPGVGVEELRPDGMYRDEVPGTDGLDVRLMAGGQEVRWTGDVRPGDRIDVRRAVTAVQRKGAAPGFLLITVDKTYTTGRGLLAEVTERFIVR